MEHIWFMSYVQVYRDGRFKYGAHSWAGYEHPLQKIQSWNKGGEKEGFTCVPLHYHKDSSVLPIPEVDILSPGITP